MEKYVLLAIQILSVIFSVFAAEFFYEVIVNRELFIEKRAFSLSFIFSFVFYFVFINKYDRRLLYKKMNLFFMNSLFVWSITFFIVLIILFITKSSYNYSRAVFLLVFLFGCGSLFLSRYIFDKIGQTDWLKDKITKKSMLIGDAVQIKAFVDSQYVGNVGRNFFLVTHSKPAALLKNQLEVQKLLDRAKTENINELIFVTDDPNVDELFKEIAKKIFLTEGTVSIFFYSPLIEALKFGQFVGCGVIADVVKPPFSSSGYFAKTIFDLISASLLIFLTGPLMLLIAIAIKATSRGPILYKQPRVGFDGKHFEIFKFRTMYFDTEKQDTRSTGREFLKQATRADPRITPVGKYLRRFSLDELPQFFNVIKADMSLVGPRPHAVPHETAFEHKVALYSHRRRVRPGLTGLAQVRGFRGEILKDEDLNQRILSDIEYVNNWSFYLDLIILLKTIPHLMFSKTAY